MKGGTQAAVALGVGYMLGRRRKLRRAAILAAVTATGRIGGVSKMLAGRGLAAVGSTELFGKLGPQLGDIAGTARGELLDAGKTAAMAAVSKQVESLSDSLHDRADVLRDPAAAGSIADALRGSRRGRAGEGDEVGDEREEYPARRDGQDEDRYGDEYEPADDDNDQYEDDYEPEDAESEDDDEPDDDYEADDQEEPAEDEERAAGPRRRRAGVTSSPVSRTGR